MLHGATQAKLAFICNVVIDSEKEIIYAVAGDPHKAHRQGCDFLLERCKVSAEGADIVIVSNGGYPLDQNVYQAVKGMSAAALLVRKNGVIIMIAASEDGVGAPEFYKTFAEERDLGRLQAAILQTPREKTRVDQWQSQVLARVLDHCRVVYLSEMPAEIIELLHMVPASTPEAALAEADRLHGDSGGSIIASPDGISVVIE